MPFKAASDSLFTSELAMDVSYVAPGEAAKTVRAVLRRPDAAIDFGRSRIQAPTVVALIRVGEIAAARPGDIVIISGANHVVQGEPSRDSLALVWTLDLRPQ